MVAHDSLDRTQSQYDRKVEREKQIEKMEQIATGVLADDTDIASVIIEEEDGAVDERTRMNPPPKGFENARRFLWDEDDDEEEDPYYKKSSPSPDQSTSLKSQKNRPGLGVFPINLAPRFQLDRGDASPAMYGDSEAGFAMTDMRGHIGGDFHSAYRKSFAQRRVGKDSKTSHVCGVIAGCMSSICRPCSTGSERCVACWARLSRTQKILVVLFGLACLGLSIFGIVALANSGGSGSGSSTSESTFEVPDTLDVERYEDIRTMILDAGVSEPNNIDKEGSPQHKALLWLTDYDPAVMDVEDQRLIERHAFATFFFSTHADSDVTSPTPRWDHAFHWMTESDICSWHGIRCVVGDNESADREEMEDPVLHLNLTANGVEGTIPSELAALEHLKMIDLGFNSMTGSIPESLGNLQHLKYLIVHDNLLTGTIPTELGMCTMLHNITLDRNDNIEGTLPTEFTELINLRHFGVHKNKLVGPLLDVSKMPYLEILEQGENQFTGTIPTEYGALSTLKELRLRENELTGTVPTELGQLSLLVVFHHSHNTITGTIPLEMAGLTSLADYRFQHNSMHGPLPSEIGLLTNLENLNLEDNEFTGTLPLTLENLTNLHKFRFFRNEFSGTVPDGLCDGRWWKELAGDCGDIGKIVCECCTHCGGN